MNYIDLINNFWDEAPNIKGYKPQYSCLYFGIIDSINRNFWKETSIEYDRIISKTGMDKRMYLEAREWLSTNGFIEFTSGKNNYSPAKYRVQNCTATVPSDVPLMYLNSTTTVPSDVPIIKEDNKQDTNKQINKKEKTKNVFTPPTILEVENYFFENGYKREAGSKAYNYYAIANWKDSKGNGVKNWKQKMHAVWFKDEHKMMIVQPSNRPTINYGRYHIE
jgi:hypothetical protein